MVTTIRAMSSDQTLPSTFPMRRHSRAIFGVLGLHAADSAAGLPGGEDASTGAAIDQSRRRFALPDELRTVPGRHCQSPTILAAGFSDARATSVGVDIARWTTPCSKTLDDIAWRRIFTWVVWADEGLAQVSILEPPARDDDRMIGAYAYEIDGAQGYGVLQIAAGDDDAWYVCDCWGDAADADRIDHLSNFISNFTG